MKVATRDDKAEWLVPPAGITSARVCRISGKLAADGCDDVEVVATNGQLERRSMIYTEYFAKGTEPATFCDQHLSHGIMTKLAGLFGADHPPAPPRVEDTGAAPGAAATAGTVPPAQAEVAPPAPPQKKRGFWSRLFGKGNSDQQREEQATPKKKGG
jgi:penicillin-binding protein 1A